MTNSDCGMGVGETVVVKGGAVTLKPSHRDDHATLPYLASESVGEAILAQVVVDWFLARKARLLKGGAYVGVDRNVGRGVA